MDCPLCQYRKIARQALDALEIAGNLLGTLDYDAQQHFRSITDRLTGDFRRTYRAEHPLSLASPV